MKSIAEIYSDYRIMRTLQEHQLRVAAVASLICESLPHVDKDGVVKACLLHDMGNIIKFDLSYFPEFVQPEGLAYWEGVKSDYVTKYGPSEHAATEAIAGELGVSQTVMEYISGIGFSKVELRVTDDSLEKKICCYADQRVDPHGVVSIEDRLAEGRKRYAGRAHKTLDDGRFEFLAAGLRELEQQIFKEGPLRPSDVTNETIASTMRDIKAVAI